MAESSATACASCDHDPACGFAGINNKRYCHTDDHSCYELAQIDNFFDLGDHNWITYEVHEVTEPDDILAGSSLDPEHLYVPCEPCRLAGRGNRIARDPFDDSVCVYGHTINYKGQS